MPKNKRLIQNGEIVYPITLQGNVIGLQKTITDKLPIISSSQPQTSVPERQVWIDVGEEAEEIEEVVQPTRSFFVQEEEQLTFENNEEDLSFDNSNNNDNIVFEGEN